MVKGKIQTMKDLYEENLEGEKDEETDYNKLYEEPKPESKQPDSELIAKIAEVKGIIKKDSLRSKLDDIINLAKEWNSGKYKKIIQLSNECKKILESL